MKALAAALACSLVCAIAEGRPRLGRQAGVAPQDWIAGGAHWRFATPQGPIHVWHPPHFDPRRAGIVIYVHGFFIRVDEAMREHGLPDQFAASHQNALFVVPEAPASAGEAPLWNCLEALFERVGQGLRRPLPSGPVVVVGHRGAYRTLVAWLGYRVIAELILVDALYGGEDDFAAWLEAGTGRMTLVTRGTTKWTEPFVGRFPDCIVRSEIPERFEDFTRREREARLLYLHSQYGHLELIAAGRTLPLLLRRSGWRSRRLSARLLARP